MPPVELHPLAVREARDARRWYARTSAARAGRFQAAIDDGIARVGASPQSHPPHLYGTRVCRLRRFPYQLVFVEEPARVVVIAVAHDRRRPGYWRRRRP